MITDINFWGENPIVNGGVKIEWSDEEKGFGVIDIIKTMDGKIIADTEYMGKDFLKEILLDMINIIDIID
jgi:hypothetical protein